MLNRKLALFVAAVLIASPVAGQSIAPSPRDKTVGQVEDASVIAATNHERNELLRAVKASMAEEAKLTASDASGGNRFGFSVSLDGDRALVGAPNASAAAGNFIGVAYVFVRNGSSWTEEAKLIPSAPHSEQNAGNFGLSVSLNGDRALVGAPNDDVATGAAYVFVRSGSSWTEEVRLVADDGVQFAAFGDAVSLDGDRALVGSRSVRTLTQSNVGAAYFFVRSGTSWSQEAKVMAADPSAFASFGVAVSLDGDVALIGANGSQLAQPIGTAGAAYFFERSGNTWNQTDRVFAGDATKSMEFGGSVSLDGSRALIGAKAAAGSMGAAYIFSKSGITWTEEAKLAASDGTTNDLFGASVSLEGDYALVGANNNGTTAGAGAGTAYVFARSGSLWNETEILTAGDADGSEEFGVSVSLDNGRALVGAKFEDLPSAGNAGAAYVFGVTPVSIESDEALASNRLDPPFPNPSRGVATFRFTLENSGPVSLVVYDVRGRHIATALEGVRGRGVHEEQVDSAQLPSGVYFVRLVTALGQSTQPLLVVD